MLTAGKEESSETIQELITTFLQNFNSKQDAAIIENIKQTLDITIKSRLAKLKALKASIGGLTI